MNLSNANLGYNARRPVLMQQQQQQPQPQIGYFNRFSNYLRQFRNMGYQNLDAQQQQQQLPWRQSMQQRIAAVRERAAGWRLPRFKMGGDEMHSRLIEVRQPRARLSHGSTMARYAKRARRFLQSHKRGILYGLGAAGVGTGAVLTGIYATKRNKEEEDMREGNTGTLSSLIKGDSYGFGGGGGGGGGGFGGYNYPPATIQKKLMRRRKRKKKQQQQQLQNVKGGRVVKKKKQQQRRRRTTTTKKSKKRKISLSINKQKKHMKKKKIRSKRRFAAF
jgi:hypothetical protein